MVDVKGLRDAMRRKKLTVAQLASAVGVDDSTFYRKLQGCGETFTLAQADAITRSLGLGIAEAQEIFFSRKLAKTREEEAKS